MTHLHGSEASMQQVDGEKPAESAAGGSNVSRAANLAVGLAAWSDISGSSADNSAGRLSFQMSATAPAAGQEDEAPKAGGEFRECSAARR